MEDRQLRAELQQLRDEREVAEKEKEELKQFYENRIRDLSAHVEQLEAKLARAREAVTL